MSDQDISNSPRKKVKLNHTPLADIQLDSMVNQVPSSVTSRGPDSMEAKLTSDQHEAFNDQQSKEAICGITEFVSPDLLGFSGILKKRYTDFLVNEILPSGRVVHLDNTRAPKRSLHNDEEAELPKREPLKENNPALATPSSASQTPQPTINRSQVSVDKAPASQIAPHLVGQKRTGYPATAVSDPLAHHFADLPPDQRPPTSNMANVEEQPLLLRQPTEEAVRQKQKVNIRYTSEGWVEVDEEQEKVLDEQKAAARMANGHRPHDIQDDQTMTGTVQEQTKAVYTPQASTQAQWQAYASAPKAEDPTTDVFQLQSEDKRLLLSYFTEQVVDAICALYNRTINSPHRKASEHGSVTSAVIDRQLRTKIHQDIRRIFSSRLETTTNGDGAMVVTAMSGQSAYNSRPSASHNGKGDDRQKDRGNERGNTKRGKLSFQELGGDYLHFSLYKENKDTMEAISWLAKQLKLRPQLFQFAGTKDRRGVTVQRVSVYRVFIQRMIDAGRDLRYAKIGNFEYQPSPLQLGELTGNEFIITLRDCDFHYPEQADTKTLLDGAQAIVGQAIRNLSQRGFINYYGLQRFGTFSTGTDEIGVRILQGDFRAAIGAILHYNHTSISTAQDPNAGTDKVSMEDRARAQAIREFSSTGKPYPALDLLPRKYSAESAIIRHLSRQGHNNDYLGALQSISRNLRLMYVHAYQSLVWNMAASKRWRLFGSKVVEGDLVLVNEHTAKNGNPPKPEDVDEDGEAVVLPAADDRATTAEDMFVRARALSKEEADSGRYSIFDIVLPTPGYDIVYPANEMVKLYEEFMASPRGGGLNPHDMRRQWKDASLSGSYRKVLAKPGQDISFEIKAYEKDDEQFVQTDMDRLKAAGAGGERRDDPQRFGISGKSANSATSGDAFRGQHDQAPIDTVDAKIEVASSEDAEQSGGVSLDWNGQPKDNKKIAVVLKLQLGSSQYATMALRELMKLGGVKAYKPEYGGGR